MSDPNTKLKQKIWMMAAIMPAFKLAKGANGSEEIKLAEEKVAVAQSLFRSENFEQAAEEAKLALRAVKASAKLLPKTARRIVGSQLERIGRY